MNVVYRKKNFRIYSEENGTFVVCNMRKNFEEGHTHISNYNTAKLLINLCLNNELPNTKKTYLVISLIRLTTSNDYKQKLEKILSNMKSKKKIIER